MAAPSSRARRKRGGRVALGGCPPRAPTDPYVLTLEHTVPQPTDSPPAKAPEAFQSSYRDMRWNLDVFRKFPSIESAGGQTLLWHRADSQTQPRRRPSEAPPRLPSVSQPSSRSERAMPWQWRTAA